MARRAKDALQKLFDIDVGREIRNCRFSAKLTQKQLAEATGLSAQQISRYEAGTNTACHSTLELIAAQLGRSGDHFRRRETAGPVSTLGESAAGHAHRGAGDLHEQSIVELAPLLQDEAKRAISVLVRMLTSQRNPSSAA